MSSQDLLAARKGPLNWVVAHQIIDLVPAAAVIVFLWWSQAGNGLLTELGEQGRRSLYQTVATISTTMLGLTMTTISILAASIDKPLGGSPRGIPPTLVKDLAKPMFGLARTLGVSLTAALTLLVIGTMTTNANWWSAPALAALAVVIGLRITRVMFLLSHLLQARTN